MIAAIVQQKKPVQGEKGQYGYVRKAEEKPKKTRKKRGRNNVHNNTEQKDVHDEEYLALDDKGEGSAGQIQLSPSMHVQMYMPGAVPDPIPLPGIPAPGGGPLDTSGARKSPAEEEMDDADESAEWVIRVGNAEPPQWGKRKATEESSEDGSQKRQKTRWE
jgi:hypothetical protein